MNINERRELIKELRRMTQEEQSEKIPHIYYSGFRAGIMYDCTISHIMSSTLVKTRDFFLLFDKPDNERVSIHEYYDKIMHEWRINVLITNIK